jgi:hypothetical protein
MDFKEIVCEDMSSIVVALYHYQWLAPVLTALNFQVLSTHSSSNEFLTKFASVKCPYTTYLTLPKRKTDIYVAARVPVSGK